MTPEQAMKEYGESVEGKTTSMLVYAGYESESNSYNDIYKDVSKKRDNISNMTLEEAKNRIKDGLKQFISKSEHWTEKQLSSMENTIEAQSTVISEFLYEKYKREYMGKENALGEKYDDTVKPENIPNFLSMRNRTDRF